MFADNSEADLVRDLESLALPEPPRDLKAAVLAKLAGRRPAPRTKLLRPLTALAWAAAAAAVLAVMARLPGPVPAQVSATMSPQDAGAWPLVNRFEAPGGAVTVRRRGDRFAFFLEGKGTPSLRWDPAQWEPLAATGNPVVLRLRTGAATVSLRVDGVELLQVPVAAVP